MEKRRKKIRKEQKKKDNKAKKHTDDIDNTQIEIVPEKKMEDYDIDSLAETLAIAKKMLRNHPRE